VNALAYLTGGILPVLYTLAVCTLIERFAALEHHSIAARLPGAMMNIVEVVGSAALSWPVGELLRHSRIGSIFTIPLWRLLQPMGAAGYAIQILILVVTADFLAYWQHRAEHRWFWPIHAVHHAPTELHAANSIGHPAQIWFRLLFITIPLRLFQFDGPQEPTQAAFIMALLAYYIHSPVDVHFGPFRKVLVDNRFHRIHHSLDERHFDKNFAICFSLWDRLFGTAYDPSPDEWPDVGLANMPPPRSILDYLLLPLRFTGGNGRHSCEHEPDDGDGECLSCAASSPRS
jgi:sterol desaturase/sphingolipid hydroxylase (fatty acid hydroxylase superfamily)